MSFAQWTHVALQASGAISAEEITGPLKIRGNSSLAYATPPVPGAVTQPRIVSGWTAGVTSNNGLIQTLFRLKQTASSTGGLVFAQMQGSISPDSECYFLAWNGTSLVMARGNLTEFSGGAGSLPGGSNVLLGSFSTSPVTANDGDVYALELKWQYDVESGGLIIIGGYDGPIADPTTYDYETINKVITVTDAIPLLDGVTAGLGWSLAGGFGGADVMTAYDHTEIFWPE